MIGRWADVTCGREGMASEPIQWEYGDAAMILCSDGEERIALFGERLGGPAWTFPDGKWRWADDSIARPLDLTTQGGLVLDPNSKRDVALLRDALADAGAQTTYTRIQTALTSLLGAPEPRASATVVRAVCECSKEPHLFVRDDESSEHPESPWKAACGSHDWSDLTRVVVL